MFPERLKALRLEANLTQNDVSRQFGVSQPTYSNWEKGEKKPTPDKYPKIAEFYNVSTDYLLGKSDYKNSDEIDLSTFEVLYRKTSKNLSDEEKKAYIGLAFRLTSNDLNFLSDLLTKSGVYTKPTAKLTKFTNMKPYLKAVNFANFEDYVNKVGLPYYQKHSKASSIDDLKKASSLRIIEDYLRTSPKIAAVTNADELILSQKDIAFLKDVFKDRLVIYPRGGHCGNMFYKENVDVMVNFVNKGVLKYEN